MATRTANLDTAIDNAAIALAAWDMQRNNYADQGRSEQWTTQFQALCDKLETLQKAKQLLSGPICVRSFGRS